KNRKENRFSFQIPQHLKIDTKLTIPKISNIKIKLSRRIEGKIKTATISKTPTNKCFISILVEQDKQLPKKSKITEKTTIGIDLGIKTFATISDGRKIDNPKFFDKSLKRLKKQQRRLSKKKKGSNNRTKQRLKVARLFGKINNQGSDFLHKISHQLTHENQVKSIAIEDLNVSGLLKNHYLARVISDVSWGEFRRQLEYKCDWYGRNLMVIGRFEASSKACGCGYVNQELKLSDRGWTCLKCKTMHDRDLLASQNIKRFALIGSGRPKSTLVESSR
ncbi:MAG: RNA-guided endonuclease TnpB family protein, partial [bacterium]|nr:RNA-guided endonuclease TnpB family protein [bacterium]